MAVIDKIALDLGDVIRGAAEHAVPDPRDVPLDIVFEDTVAFLFAPWYAGNKRWNPSEMLRDAYHMFHDDAIYAKPPVDNVAHYRMACSELNYVLRNMDPDIIVPTTWVAWAALAQRDTQRAYPCIVGYTGREPVAKEFARRVLSCFVEPVRDARALTMYQNTQRAFGVLQSNVDLFHRVATYRRAIRVHRQWPKFSHEHFRVTRGDFKEAYAPLQQLLLTPCTRVSADVLAVNNTAMTREQIEQDLVQNTAKIREMLITLLASRLIKELVLDYLTARLQNYLAYEMPLQPSYATRIALDVSRLREALVGSGVVMSSTAIDDDDSIYTLARHYASRREEALDEADLKLITADVKRVLQQGETRWLHEILVPISKAVATHWIKQVPHVQNTADVNQAVAITAQLRAELTQVTRPSYVDMKVTAAQLQWRQTSSAWWHKTAGRARVCACTKNQVSFVHCMLRHLFALLLHEEDSASTAFAPY